MMTRHPRFCSCLIRSLLPVLGGLALLVLSACTPSSSPESASPDAAPTPDAPGREQEPGKTPSLGASTPFRMPVRVRTSEAVFTPEDASEGETLLVWNTRLFATGLSGDSLSVTREDGHRGTLPFCETDFGLLAARKAPESRALPSRIRLLASRQFVICLNKGASDPETGLVIQGPVALSPSPAQAPAPTAPVALSFDLLRLEPDPETPPPGWRKVRLGPQQTGYIDRHHLAVGGEPGYSFQTSPSGVLFTNPQDPPGERSDFWMIATSFDRLTPLAIDAGQDETDLESIWLEPPRRLDAMQWVPPLERYTWDEAAIWKQTEGVWMPAGEPAPSCDRLPTRLHVRRGSLRLTRGKVRDLTWTVSRFVRHADGRATLSARQTGDAPALMLYWVAAHEGERAIRWLVEPDPEQPAPTTWIRLDEAEAKRREQKAAVSLGCAPDAP